ncbi:MAG TPA: hypothetical protein PKD55_05825 [Bellilinea sp.]|nr:hypothetical protein [Bellilinea sp.]
MTDVNILIKAIDQAGSVLHKAAAEVGNLGKAGDTVAPGIGKANMSLTDFKSGIDLAMMAADTFMRVGKAAFDFTKEGAQLDFTRNKFDRLSASIGTTGDVLLKDLRRATRGLVSDADLVASATNFMTLGLVKTHDEAIRLTKVAGALGMNMNQLVLTLTNQTTMRFDALGVSVDGFDEKVKALKDSGMDANAAFNEAFLQQAEEQVAKVGEAADSSIAGFNRLETEIKNIGDTIQMVLAPAAGDLFGQLGNLIGVSNQLWQAVANGNMTYWEAVKVWGEMQWTGKTAEETYQELTAATDENTEATKENTAANIEAQGPQALTTTQIRELGVEIGKTSGATRNFADDIYESGPAYDEMTGKLDAAEQAVRNLSIAFGDLTNQKLAEESYRAIQAAWDEGLLSEEAYRGEMAKVAATLGDQSAEAINASIKLALLKRDYETGKISLEEYLEKVQALNSELNGIPKNIQVLISIRTEGDAMLAELKGGGIYNPYGGGKPGGGKTGKGLALGGSFIIPPGYPNDSFYLGMGHYGQSGERVTVTPDGGSPASGMNITQTNIYNNIPAPDPLSQVRMLGLLYGGA